MLTRPLPSLFLSVLISFVQKSSLYLLQGINISAWIMNYDMVIVIYGIWDKDECVKGGEVLGTSRMVFMGDMTGQEEE